FLCVGAFATPAATARGTCRSGFRRRGFAMHGLIARKSPLVSWLEGLGMPPETTPGRTTLVVEDDAAIREGFAAGLRREGFTVLVAENGQEALDYLARGPLPDLILLDMLMPVLDGWHFLKLVKQIDRAASTPILVITGAICLTREWATAQGCDGFVRKPISM